MRKRIEVASFQEFINVLDYIKTIPDGVEIILIDTIILPANCIITLPPNCSLFDFNPPQQPPESKGEGGRE